MKKVNIRIKEIRVKKGLSQENVAEELGIVHGTYNKIEKGNIVLTVDRLYLLAKIFKVSVVELLGEEQPEADYSKCPNCKRLEKQLDNNQKLIDRYEEDLGLKKKAV